MIKVAFMTNLSNRKVFPGRLWKYIGNIFWGGGGVVLFLADHPSYSSGKTGELYWKVNILWKWWNIFSCADKNISNCTKKHMFIRSQIFLEIYPRVNLLLQSDRIITGKVRNTSILENVSRDMFPNKKYIHGWLCSCQTIHHTLQGKVRKGLCSTHPLYEVGGIHT